MEVCGRIQGWGSFERNILRQRRKHYKKVCEWEINKTITPPKKPTPLNNETPTHHPLNPSSFFSSV